jgi:peptidyl-prolyl cis-trans isomerase C
MRRAVVAAALVAAGLVARTDTRADDGASADAARRAQVVVHLGPTRTITVGELEDRIAAVPPFQRATFGDTPDDVRRRFLTEVLLPETLLSLGAQGEKLDQKLPTSYAVERALSQATLRAIRSRIGPESAIPMADVQRYYDDHRARYDTPERYQLWRILCRTRDEAAEVIAAAKKEPTPKEFGELARDHSIDAATRLRAGNLGFVTADGTSNEPGLRVDPAVVRAAQGVRDGDIVPTPVPEGDGFAVVWRRGTIAATRRTVDDAAAQIRDTLWKERVKKETDELLASLRAARVRDVNEALLDSIDVPQGDGGVGVRAPAPSSSSVR